MVRLMSGMQRESRVKVHSKLTVVSGMPSGLGKSHRLSALDHAMGLHTVHVVFYYQAFLDADGSFESAFEKLRASLSELLCRYPSVTGRLARRQEDDNWEVKCNDAGVRTLKATVGTTLDEWLRSADVLEERDLTAWDDLPDDPSIWSPFRIQFSEFEGGGLAIGLSFTHIHADPTSASLLLKSWADVHRGMPLGNPPLFHLPTLQDQLSMSKTPTRSTKYYSRMSEVLNTASMKMATATFRLSNSMMKRCISQVHDKYSEVTPFDVLAALFWRRIVLLKAFRHKAHTHSLVICVDTRKLMHLPTHEGYFGNALHFTPLSLDSKELDGGDLGDVAELVHRHVAEEQDILSVVEWLESQKGNNGKYPLPFRMYGPQLTCISMEHMIAPGGGKESSTNCESLVYGVMFKKGEKPVHVSYHVGNVEGEGLIIVMPSPEEGLARTVTVTLPEEQIAKLCEDQDILGMDPSMIISGTR